MSELKKASLVSLGFVFVSFALFFYALPNHLAVAALLPGAMVLALRPMQEIFDGLNLYGNVVFLLISGVANFIVFTSVFYALFRAASLIESYCRRRNR